MTANTNRTVIIALVALSLALFACADTSKKDTAPARSPAGAAVSGASASGAPSAGVSGSGVETGQAEPQSQPSANSRLTEEERNTIEVVRKTRNCVVYVINF